jgi:hypothetical protein
MPDALLSPLAALETQALALRALAGDLTTLTLVLAARLM